MPAPYTATALINATDLKDYARWQKGRIHRGATTMSMMGVRLMAGAVAITGGILALILLDLRPRQGGLIVVLLVAAFYAGLYAHERYVRRETARQFAAQREAILAATHERTWTLADDGLTTSSINGHASWSWSAFTEATQSDGLLLLCTDAQAGVPIPLRGFATPEQATEAAAYAKSKITGRISEALSTPTNPNPLP